jgi:hypothetical protein
MSFLTYYCIFAVATAVTSCLFFFLPRLNSAKDAGINNDLVNNPKISCVTYTVVGCVIAPVLFCILVLPGVAKNYMEGLDTILREEKS